MKRIVFGMAGDRESGPVRAGEDGRQRRALRVYDPAGQLPGCVGRESVRLTDTLLPTVNQCRVPVRVVVAAPRVLQRWRSCRRASQPWARLRFLSYEPFFRHVFRQAE